MKDISIIHGDAYKLIKELSDDSVDLIITDPPYFIEGVHDSYFNGRKLNNFETMVNKSLDLGFDFSILDDFVRVMKRINIYIWCNKNMMFDIMSYFKKFDCNFEVFKWCKTNPLPFCKNHFLSDTEYCLYFYDKGLKLNNDYYSSKTYFNTQINKWDASDYGHPCCKPEFIINTFIKNSSKEGDLILDAFVGSGTVPYCCSLLFRRFIGYEIDKKYYDISLERLEGFNQKGEMNIFAL